MESQGIVQPAPSQTSSKICEKCGKEFNHAGNICIACKQARYREERITEAQKELPGIIEQQRELWAEGCGVPLKFIDKRLDNFERKYQGKAFEVIAKYAWGEDNAKSIVLLSPEWYGAGKTHLVSGLVHKIINTAMAVSISRDGFIKKYQCPVFFTTETDLLARIRATYNRQSGDDGEREEDIYQKLERYQLLIIDDVGKVKPRDYAFLQQVYYRLIDGRYTKEQPIILTTNLTPGDLEAHIGGSCADRLREMAGINFVVMKGTSYRLKDIKKHG